MIAAAVILPLVDPLAVNCSVPVPDCTTNRTYVPWARLLNSSTCGDAPVIVTFWAIHFEASYEKFHAWLPML
jgi:hypothetical protein